MPNDLIERLNALEQSWIAPAPGDPDSRIFAEAASRIITLEGALERLLESNGTNWEDRIGALEHADAVLRGDGG